MKLLMCTARRGFTLAELIVTLAVIAILAVIAAVAAPPVSHATDQSTMSTTIGRARARALASGHPVQDSVTLVGGSHVFRAMPDGAVLADSVVLHALTD